MVSIAKALVWLSIIWAAALLAAQVLGAKRGRGQEFSRRSGDPARGILYNFTTAMMPARKETARRNPAEFAAGMVLHAGILMALTSLLFLLVLPDVGLKMFSIGRPVFALSFICGLILLARRITSRNLRAMSAPDDFIAILATCGLLALSSFSPLVTQTPLPILIYSIVLFVYLPLGKLRHMVFFFAARADYGRRLGYRGVYPPARVEPK